MEIENMSAEVISLAGFSLGVNAPGEPLVRWPFRSAAQLNARERMVVYFGSLPLGFVPQSNSQVFAVPLNDASSVLTLRDSRDQILDEVEYGLQITDRSLGRVNQEWVLLASPSPGQANSEAAVLDPGDGLRLNEWFAAGGGTNDFVELYNPAPLPVNLAGWVLTDDPSISGATNNRIAPLTFIDAGAFVRFRADGDTDHRPDHTFFQIDRFGETIRLLNPAARIIDTIDLANQADSVSEGRYPDGAPQIVRFYRSVSPAAPNYLPSGDSDQDGMDDAWEVLNGFDPTLPNDAASDADNDGMSNLVEFLSGTNPRDASSFFRVELADTTDNRLAIRFIAQPGRVYRIEYTDGLFPAAWTGLSNVPSGDTVRTIVVSDSTLTAQRLERFYRVVIPR